MKNQVLGSGLITVSKSTAVRMTRIKNIEEYYTLFMVASTEEKQKKNITELYESLKEVEKGKQW
ncbi:hypothetical protein VQ01_08990 [Tamlana sp. s12]|nr:hypothetical protein VQ01_08990 [Tamlana sp. s12]